jgi:VWFA-related protein
MRAAYTFVAIVAAVSGAAAQTQSGETFQAGVTMIQVPVVVRDHDGHVVAGLGKDDFELFDNGKLQEIAGFSVENAASQVAPDRSVDANASGAPAAGGTGMEIPARFVTYFFDDVTLRDPGDMTRIRDAAARQLGALQPGDRAAIFTSSCRVELDFTNDRAKLQAALARLEVRPSQLCRVSQAQTLQVTLLRAVLSKMSKLPARRQIILVSSGFFVGHDRSAEEAELIEAAIRSKVSIDAIDAGETTDFTGSGAATAAMSSKPRYANPSNPIVLVDLAHGTGGAYLTGNDFGVSFHKLATPESHYLLSFIAAKADGRFHQLKVKLKESHKMSVEARNGYFAGQRAE